MQSQGSGINRDVCFTLNSTDVHAVAVIGVDLYNQTLTGGVAMSMTAKRSDPHHVPCVMILNDMGGAVMHVSYDVTSTLRSQTKHHEPIVLVYDARGNGGGRVSPTITGDHQDSITDYTAIVVEVNNIAKKNSEI